MDPYLVTSMNYRNVLALGIGASLLLTGVLSCGAPNYCKEGSFPEFKEDEWEPYCERYTNYLEDPGQYTVEEVTEFFANHPKKIKELREQTMSYEKGVEACFQSNREQLDYRNLNKCLEYDDEQQQLIVNSWTARIEPWLENHQLRINETRPKLGDAKRTADRLMLKTNDALEFSREMDPSLYEKWVATLDELDERIEKGKRMGREWDDLVDLASESDVLTAAMADQIAPEIADLNKKIEDQRATHDDLTLMRRYLTFAVYASGKPCPQGIKSSKEQRIADKGLKKELNQTKGTKPRISSSILKDQREDQDYESFTGFICGQRGRGNQFSGQPVLCGIHRFKMERSKPTSEKRKWTNWRVVSFEESGPDTGVDCRLNKK